MINVSKVVKSPRFLEDVTIERTTGGKRIHGEYKADPPTIITIRGVITNPKGTTQLSQTAEGTRAAGYLNLYVDADTPIYITHDRADGNDISDVIIRDKGLPSEARYRIYNVADYKRYGYSRAEAMREGAI